MARGIQPRMNRVVDREIESLSIVQETMVGHKLGEFSPTRTFRGHVKDDRKSKRR